MNSRRIRWSADLAYAVGLITSDGCLSKDGRHVDLTSKDLQQIENFKKILNLKAKIGLKSSGSSNKKYFRIEFGDVKFYRFLVEIGLTPHKSKTLGSLEIPNAYFRDFLRGCLDGDGYTYSYWDPRWKSSFMFYTGFVSASRIYTDWLRSKIKENLNLVGHIDDRGNIFQIKFAKKESVNLMKQLYYKKGLICLGRKRFKIKKALGIINRHAGMGKLVDPHP